MKIYNSDINQTIQLSPDHFELLGEKWIILDIETTGFHRDHCFINILGLIYVEGEKITLSQLFNDDGQSEKVILEKFLDDLDQFNPSYVITYNGKAFDFPFIQARMANNGLDEKEFNHFNIDLYRLVMSNKKLLNLENYKLKSIEKHLGIYREDQISGKENIDMYEDFLKTQSEDMLKKILLHNHEDMENIIPLLKLLELLDSNNQFIQRRFEINNTTFYMTNIVQVKDFINISIHPSKDLSYFGDWITFNNGILKIPTVTLNKHTLLDVQKVYKMAFSDFDSETLILSIENEWNHNNLITHISNILSQMI